MRQSFPRYLPPNAPIYYDLGSHCYSYTYDNGGMAVIGGNQSMSSGIELDGVVFALTQDVARLREQVDKLLESATPSNDKTGGR
jgi:hypothetical protein